MSESDDLPHDPRRLIASLSLLEREARNAGDAEQAEEYAEKIRSVRERYED